MKHASNLIVEEMERKNIKYSVIEKEEYTLIKAGFSIDNGPNVEVIFISNDDCNDVAIRLMGLVVNIDDGRKESILEALNTFNDEYRFLKFVLDKDCDINIEYDIPNKTKDDSVGPMCCEIFIWMMQVVDDVYPKLMSVMWS